jgi:hypothetical protein
MNLPVVTSKAANKVMVPLRLYSWLCPVSADVARRGRRRL